MKTCSEIRLQNLLSLIREAGGESALATRYGATEPYIKQMARGYKDSKSGTPKGIGDSAARMLETCMEKERGWMDHDHSISDHAYAAARILSMYPAEEQLEMLHYIKVEHSRRKHPPVPNDELAPANNGQKAL